MLIITPEFIKGKRVLLRLDIDVCLKDGVVEDDFRLRAGLPTLELCLQHASQTIIMGHLGRPEGKEDSKLSVVPIYNWLEKQGLSSHLTSGKLKILENLRFEEGEITAALQYAKELANLGEVYVNEAFAAYHSAASTTVLPTLLPHVAGLRFAQEVEKLTEARDNPQRPLVVILGGAKVEDKLPLIEIMSKIADYILVGGKIAGEMARSTSQELKNILVAELNEEGTDITAETVKKWEKIIREARMIVWNGPLGKVEEPKNFQTHKIANLVIASGAETIIGGGDTLGYLEKLGLLGRFGFVSTGGGAMLEFLTKGTLPTIEALK